MKVVSPDLYDEWTDWAKALVADLRKVIVPSDLVKTGAVMSFYGTVQSGWLKCDGSVFPAATYPALSQLLGSTTLPNLTSPHGVGYVVGIKT